MVAADQILMGKVAATHGIKGQLRIVPYSGSVDTFLTLKSILLRDAAGRTSQHELLSVAAHGKKVIVTLKEFSEINQVLHFIGSEILLRRDQFPPTEDDEYYWYDLVGMKVVTVDGSYLGTLESIIETGSNDVYVVASGDNEYLVPAIEDIVQSVDLAAKVMTITPFEGLFDL